jgi:polysaccharide deacetylase family protein (PEP-CTERM system associated)
MLRMGRIKEDAERPFRRRRGLVPGRRVRDRHRQAPTGTGFPSGSSATPRRCSPVRRGRGQGTFFTLGWVAERYPALIRRDRRGGARDRQPRLGPRSRLHPDGGPVPGRSAPAHAAIAEAAGVEPKGYRAPSFSIDKRTPWAHPILAEEGYAYSSSVAPLAHDHYGWPEAPRFAHRPLAGFRADRASGDHGRRRRAAAGGRGRGLLPAASLSILRAGRSAGSIKEGRPAVFYFHPWEIDPDQPRWRAPLKSRLRHYSRLSAMRPKLLKILKAHRWGRTDEVVAAERERLQ